jgi:hypothetical protein
MEKFLFFKKIEKVPSQSKLCGLPHKNVVMIYTCLLFVAYFLFAMDNRIFHYYNVPYFVIFLFTLVSVLSFVLPCKKVELMKIFYYFNTNIFYLSLILFLIAAGCGAYQMLLNQHYCFHVFVPALLSFSLIIVILFFTFSIYCYIKEDLKNETSNDIVKVDTTQRKNFFIFLFKIPEINIKNHEGKLEILSIIGLIMSVGFFSYIGFESHEREESLNIIKMIMSLLTITITLSKNQDLFTLHYYLYFFYLIILFFFMILNSHLHGYGILLVILKLFFFVFQKEICKEILIRSLILDFENKKNSQNSSQPEELPIGSRIEATFNINSINDSESLRNLETVQRDYTPPSLFNKI